MRWKVKHNIEFNEATHTYLVDGKEVPSVTQILEPLHRSYRQVNPSVLAYAANRGKAAHEACEAIDYELEPEIYPEIEGYVRAYLDFKEVYRPSWEYIESIVYNNDFHYIGTLDRAGWLNDTELAVVDLKTSQPTKEALVSVCLQTMAYAVALYNDRGLKVSRYGVFLKADGSYRVVNCKEYADKYGIDTWADFCDYLHINKLTNYLLQTRREKEDE